MLKINVRILFEARSPKMKYPVRVVIPISAASFLLTSRPLWQQKQWLFTHWDVN